MPKTQPASLFSFEDCQNALKNGDFFAVYQPLYNAHTLRPISSEALVRRKMSDGSVVLPGDFIHFFEDNGLIESLDFYMLKTVCQDIRLCLDKGLTPLPVAVNFSRLHLSDPAFADKMVDIVSSYKIDTSLIIVELTETLFINDLSNGQQIIKSLSDKGFTIAMDDFGSGYSSLPVIKKIEFDMVKLDKSFLEIKNEKDMKIVSGTIKLLKKVGLFTVAEGVEEKAQFNLLRKMGCDAVQGFYFSKPLSEKDYDTFVSNIKKS